MANALQERYAEMLLDRIRADKYPSATYMNMLEQVATPRVLAEYIQYLIERIEDDEHPSIPMMRRVEGLMGRFGDGTAADEERS
jgi:hypothetical protein